jgi:hypothetical protein
MKHSQVKTGLWILAVTTFLAAGLSTPVRAGGLFLSEIGTSDVGLEYRLFKHVGVGVAYDRLMLNLDYKSGKSDGWELDASWNGGLFYGALYW